MICMCGAVISCAPMHMHLSSKFPHPCPLLQLPATSPHFWCLPVQDTLLHQLLEWGMEPVALQTTQMWTTPLKSFTPSLLHIWALPTKPLPLPTRGPESLNFSHFTWAGHISVPILQLSEGVPSMHSSNCSSRAACAQCQHITGDALQCSSHALYIWSTLFRCMCSLYLCIHVIDLQVVLVYFVHPNQDVVWLVSSLYILQWLLLLNIIIRLAHCTFTYYNYKLLKCGKYYIAC